VRDADGSERPCGAPAAFTQRIAPAARRGRASAAATASGAPTLESVVLVGDTDLYQPACCAHHVPAAVAARAWTEPVPA
jgi:thymidine kinase